VSSDELADRGGAATIACAVIGGAVGGIAGGELGGMAGVELGEVLYEVVR